MLNFDQIHSCYGCGLCAVVCPENIISIDLSAEGFYVPAILNEDKCTHCDLCEKVCSYLDGDLSQHPLAIQGYVVYSKNTQTKKTCSSGGVGFEIAKLLIEKGYKACGVKYSNTENRAEHFVADTVEDFEKSKGSKYLQSYTVDGFKKLSDEDKWVVFGTPCQIDSLRRWIKFKKTEENYVLVDFFCHGVPSYHLWNSYLTFNKNTHNLQRVDNVKFRDKRYGDGLRSYTMIIESEKKEIASTLQNNDLFYRLFLGDYCLNAACYDKCKFKNQKSSADIRIGDLWSKAYQKDDEGFSAVFANTKKGTNIINELKNSCVIKKEPLDVVSEGQMRQTLKMPPIRTKVLKDLSMNKSLTYICFYTKVLRKIKQLRSFMLGKIKNLIKRG